MNCFTCNRRILRHSHSVQCDFCHNSYHTACLPYTHGDNSINENEKWMCFNCTQTLFPFNHFESDNMFLESISEHWPKSQRFPFHRLDHYEFNPFELNESDTLSNIMNSDPDLQYFNDQSCVNNISCDYYLEQGFTHRVEELGTSNQVFSLIHLNIRSVPKNLSNFDSYYQSLNFKFSVIGFTETWLNESNCDVYSIDNYQHFSLIRENKRGGGCSLFVQNYFNVIERKDISIMDNNIEALFIELQKNDTKLENNCIIGVIYRPPSQDINDYCNKLSEILLKIKDENKIVYIMGDFNINILDSEKHLPTANFIELMYSNSLFPLISKPTRITQNTATLIDNVFCNDIKTEKFNGILFTELSDHFPVFTINYKTQHNDIQHRKARLYSAKNIKTFSNKLKEYDWKPIIENRNGNEAFNQFHSKVCQLYYDSFPVMTFKSKYRNKHVWLTEGLRKSIRIKTNYS